MEQKSFSDRKVCIVGAGISGLAATRYLLEAGFNPVVFEMKGGVGGVWRQTFQSTKLQTPRLAYQFSDFPWPSDVIAENPTHSQVLDYLESYAKQFGLLDCIQFNTRVVKVESAHQPDASAMHSAGLWGRDGGPFGDDSVWKVGVQKLSNLSGESEDEIEWHFFDFVILCVGKYGDLPRIPAFPLNGGPEVFKGTVMHSMDYAALDKDAAYGLVSGKRVVIIGEHKSARDLAAECAEANPDGPPCKMVFQRAHWALASFSIWGVPLPCLYDSRLAQFILGIPAKGVFHQTLWKLFTPLRWAVSKFVELHVRSTQPLSKYGLVPEQSFLEDVSTCQIHILPDRFFEKADKNLIQFFKCKSWDFISKGVRLDNGTELEADIVIMGTGFDVHKKLSLLSQQFANIIEKSPDCIPLYRGLIHPELPQMAVLGYSESLACIFSSEMRARWLASFLAGKFKVPSLKEMEEQAQTSLMHMKRLSRSYYKCSHSCFHIWEHDDLCRDMGRNPYKKSNWFSELFSPYSTHDYHSH